LRQVDGRRGLAVAGLDFRSSSFCVIPAIEFLGKKRIAVRSRHPLPLFR